MLLAGIGRVARGRTPWAARPAARVDRALVHLARLFCLSERSEIVVAAYVRRPVAGFPFRWGVEQLARGSFPARCRLCGASKSQIIARARRMLVWLDGDGDECRNPFRTLGVSATAGEAQIARRYRTLSKQVHPDRHTDARSPYWSARQREITEAYRVLRNPRTRAQWNARLDARKRLLLRLWEIERGFPRSIPRHGPPR